MEEHVFTFEILYLVNNHYDTAQICSYTTESAKYEFLNGLKNDGEDLGEIEILNICPVFVDVDFDQYGDKYGTPQDFIDIYGNQ